MVEVVVDATVVVATDELHARRGDAEENPVAVSVTTSHVATIAATAASERRRDWRIDDCGRAIRDMCSFRATDQWW